MLLVAKRTSQEEESKEGIEEEGKEIGLKRFAFTEEETVLDLRCFPAFRQIQTAA